MKPCNGESVNAVNRGSDSRKVAKTRKVAKRLCLDNKEAKDSYAVVRIRKSILANPFVPFNPCSIPRPMR